MAAVPSPVSPVAEHRYHRHAGVVRGTHWINVVCFTLLLMSGLQIFNAHPALYVGERSDFDHPARVIIRGAAIYFGRLSQSAASHCRVVTA